MIPILCVALLATAVCGDNHFPETFPVRAIAHHRRAKNNIYYRNQQIPILTHSDDGASKILTAFFLDIFETKGNIKEESFPIIRMAMNNFILAEMNAFYIPDYNRIEVVSSHLIGYPTVIEPGTHSNRRLSSDKMGTEMLMEIKLTFDNEPSPDPKELDEKLKDIMFDLSYFVTNLTVFGDLEFIDVTEAYRREIPTPAPTESLVPSEAPAVPPTNVDNAETGGDNDGNDTLIPSQIAIPAVLVAATLVALIMFLVARRRKRSNTENSKSEDAMLTDLENGHASFDRSLDSSKRPPSPEFPSSSISELGSQDSVFSESIADASKRLKKTDAGNTEASSTTPSSKRMYSLMNFIREDGDITVDDGYSSNHLLQPMPEEADSGLMDEKASADQDLSLSPTIIASGSANTGRESARQMKKPREKDSGGVSQLFSCGPAPKTLYQQTTKSGGNNETIYNKTPVVRNPSRDTDQATYSANEGTEPGQQLNRLGGNQDIFRPRASVTEAPSTAYRGDSAISSSRPSTMSGSRSTTPSRSRPTTPSGSTSSTPVRSRQTTPGNSNSATPNQSRTATPTRIRRTTPEGMTAVGNGRWANNEYSNPTAEIEEGNIRTSDSHRSRNATPERMVTVGNSRWADQQKTEGGSVSEKHVSEPVIPGYGCTPCWMGTSNPAQPPKTPEPRSDVFIEGLKNEVFYPTSGRRHAGNNSGVDGSAMYQANAMDPHEWSYKSFDNASVGDSTISEGDAAPLPRQIFRQPSPQSPKAAEAKPPSPKRAQDMNSIQKKIAAAKKTPSAATIAIPKRPLDIDAADSLSYASNDNDGNTLNSPSDLYSSKDDSVMSSIVCRDCYAPAGKLNIVIHSTKDGPAVHSVKPGSSLEGHIYPGDLIISVDNVDTRSFTAEHVMKMMAAKSRQERKITVLHFEEESQI
eukprot:scaffold332_cov117-Cylindrotheca_fusiformis.AAC.7